MARMNMIEAIRSTLAYQMSKDDNVLLFGEDVGYFGGVFRCTEGLQETFGLKRCFDTPISEGGIVGMAIGMASAGLRPVVEIQFSDYIYPAFDQIASEAARLRYRSNGDFTAPLTIRTPVGGGIYGGETHSQSPEALFTHVSGLKSVIPSNPYDAKGLLNTAIETNDPVMFFEPKRLYNGPFDGIHSEGSAVTVLAYGTMVWVAAAAASQSGIDAEIIDLRSLVPLDIEMITASIEKTGRCVVVHEATRTSGFGAELAAQVQERCFYSLEVPVLRVAGWDTPYPHALEWNYFPGQARVVAAMEQLLEAA